MTRDTEYWTRVAADWIAWARPLSFYTDALAQAGLTIARMAEPQAGTEAAFQRQAKWQRLPLFLWIETHNPA